MALRFRKSKSLGKGVRLNVGKKGLGLSAGVKGCRVGVGSKGAYTSMSIPGTGVHSVNYVGKSSKSSVEKGSSNLPLILVVTVLILVLFIPPIGIPLLILGGIIYYFWSKKPKQQANQKLVKANKLLNGGNYDEAIKLLKESNELDNTNKEILRLIGGALNNTEKFEDAVQYLEEFLETNPTDFDTQLVLANCFYRTKKYKIAISILQKIPEDFEQNLKTILLLAACFFEEKKYDLAIDILKKAPLLKRNLDEGLMEVHYNLALVYEKSGDKKNALKHFKKVYGQDVDYLDVTEKIETLEKV